MITVWSIFHANWYLNIFVSHGRVASAADRMRCDFATWQWSTLTIGVSSERRKRKADWFRRESERAEKETKTKSALQHASHFCLLNSSSKIERVLLCKLDEGMYWVILDRPAASGLRNWQKCIRAPAGRGAGGRRERETHWQTAGAINETRHSYHRARERKPSDHTRGTQNQKRQNYIFDTHTSSSNCFVSELILARKWYEAHTRVVFLFLCIFSISFFGFVLLIYAYLAQPSTIRGWVFYCNRNCRIWFLHLWATQACPVFGNISQKAGGVASKPAPDTSGGDFLLSQRGICALVAKRWVQSTRNITNYCTTCYRDHSTESGARRRRSQLLARSISS